MKIYRLSQAMSEQDLARLQKMRERLDTGLGYVDTGIAMIPDPNSSIFDPMWDAATGESWKKDVANQPANPNKTNDQTDQTLHGLVSDLKVNDKVSFKEKEYLPTQTGFIKEIKDHIALVEVKDSSGNDSVIEFPKGQLYKIQPEERKHFV